MKTEYKYDATLGMLEIYVDSWYITTVYDVTLVRHDKYSYLAEYEGNIMVVNIENNNLVILL